MFAWLEGRVRSWATTEGTALPGYLTAWSIDGDELAGHALSGAGFAPGEPGFHHHVRSLRNGQPLLPEPLVPLGYTVRHVRGEEDVAARVAVHRIVWAPSKVIETSHRAVMAHYPYRADLDTVVEAPDGTFAAYALGWFDPLGLVGELEPVGTHPEHRRIGLARAACLAALHRFRELGAQTALVFSDATPTDPAGTLAAHDLYVSVGMRVATIHRPWRRPLGAGAGPG
jgi:GNAT superfamily N-acetyltransferase